MSNQTRMASLYFEDGDTSNPIISIVILHTSKVKKEYVNPDTTSKEPFSLYRWTKVDSHQFVKDGNRWVANDAVMINQDMHDVWAVALQRKKNKYVEYFTQKEGFWKKLGEGIVKEVCDAAIDVIGIEDGEVTTEELQFATDKLIHHMFTSKDGDVLIENWVHWKSHQIEFKLDNKKGSIHSTDHSTACKVEKFGN